MQITLDTLARDPGQFLHCFEDQTAIIQAMDRANFHKSIFLDARIRANIQQRYRVPLAALLGGYSGPSVSARKIGYIFHVSQCGSTLLARALDHPGRSLVLREPLALRQLGVSAGAGGNADSVRSSDSFRKSLAVTASLLGKRFEEDKPLLIKANVPVNFIADDLMALAPDSPAILQFFPIDSFVTAVMRSPQHESWVENIYQELGLAGSALVAADVPATTASRAAAVWFAQMKSFSCLLENYPNTHSLHAAYFFSNPAETIAAASELFGLDLTRGEADEIAASELFQTYSKNPTLDYDAEVRVAREEDARRRLVREIDEAVSWARAAQQRHGLPDRFAKPLVGPEVNLIP